MTCFTLAGKTPFDYQMSPDSLKIDGQPLYTTTILQRLVDALSKSFGANAFPLGNARDLVVIGQAAAGFGTTFTATTGRSSQAASRLAAALVDLGILYIVDESPLLLALVPPTPLVTNASASPEVGEVEKAFARSDDAGGDV